MEKLPFEGDPPILSTANVVVHITFVDTHADSSASTPPLAAQNSVRRLYDIVDPVHVAPLGHCDMPQRR